MRKLADLLRCFRSLAYLPHVMGHLRKGGDLDAALLWLKEEDLPVMTAMSGIGRGVGQAGRYIPPPVASSSYSAHFSTPQALAPMQVNYDQYYYPLGLPNHVQYISSVQSDTQLFTHPHSLNILLTIHATTVLTPPQAPGEAFAALSHGSNGVSTLVRGGSSGIGSSSSSGLGRRRKSQSLFDLAVPTGPASRTANALTLLPAGSKGSTTKGTVDDSMVGLTFRQVAILLAHYPHCNSFTFSPWHFCRLLTEALHHSNDKTVLAVKTHGVSSKERGSKDSGSGLGSGSRADLTQVPKKHQGSTA